MRRVYKTPQLRFVRLIFLLLIFFLSSCLGEELRKQQEQIDRQQEELVKQRRELEQVRQTEQATAQKRENCNLAFRQYEQAQQSQDPQRSAELYRQGLMLCPDDEIARYELGKILAAAGRNREAEEEFSAALKINPNFTEAKNRLEALQRGK